MEKTNQGQFIRNVLILAMLIGMVLLSWLAGHILRFSIPALWHPPLRETYPQTKNGLEPQFDGIRRLVVLPGLAPEDTPLRFEIRSKQTPVSAECMGLTYFTSLPAKCRTVDGRLVQLGGIKSNLIFLPETK